MLTWSDDAYCPTAQAENVTYTITIEWPGGHGCNGVFLIVRGSRGGKRRLNLGNYKTVDQAKQACERHLAAGCDVREARRL